MLELHAFVDGVVGEDAYVRKAEAKTKKKKKKKNTLEGVSNDWTSGELHRLYPDHVRKKNSDADEYRTPILCALSLRRPLEMCVDPLKLIKVNPIPRGWLPRVPVQAKGIPYPDEELSVLADSAHEIHWRLFYGALMRLGFRADEAASLKIGDVDVDRGIVTLDENTTDSPRAASYGRRMGSTARSCSRSPRSG